VRKDVPCALSLDGPCKQTTYGWTFTLSGAEWKVGRCGKRMDELWGVVTRGGSSYVFTLVVV
jgi:hypothetical protein